MNDYRQGVELYRRFNEADPEHIDKIILPEYDYLVKIGDCTDIAYLAHDGKNYLHSFKVKSRPELAVTPNGTHLVLFGGRFKFTDRGIVDR